jgi:hypothetical protein
MQNSSGRTNTPPPISTFQTWHHFVCNASCLAPTGLLHAEAKLLTPDHNGDWMSHPVHQFRNSVRLSRHKQLNVQASPSHLWPQHVSCRSLTAYEAYIRQTRRVSGSSLHTGVPKCRSPASEQASHFQHLFLDIRHGSSRKWPFLRKCWLSILPKNVHCLSFTLFLIIPLIMMLGST